MIGAGETRRDPDELSRTLRMPWLASAATCACAAALVAAGLTVTVPTGEPATVIEGSSESVTVLVPSGRASEEIDGKPVLVRFGRTELRGTVSGVSEESVVDGAAPVLTAVVNVSTDDTEAIDPNSLRVIFLEGRRPLLLDVFDHDTEA